MTYTSMLLLSLAGYSLILAWICLMGERAAAAKEVRELNCYVGALEQGVDELHSRCATLKDELSDAVHMNMALEHYSLEALEEAYAPACPSCGSDDRSGRCFVYTGVGTQHVLCRSPWHRD